MNSSDDREAAEFLEAMARLERTPDKDRAAAESRPKRSRRTPQRQIRRTDAVVDLHGLRRNEARARLASAVSNAIRCRQRTLLVITGKGNRSPGGVGVLKAEVMSWVRQKGKSSIEFTVAAPRRLGGRGALVLFLAAR